jgi:hypothetical protein
MHDPILTFNNPTKPLAFPVTAPDGALLDPVGEVSQLLFLESCLVNALRGHTNSTDTVLRATALLMESRMFREKIYKTPEWAAAFA